MIQSQIEFRDLFTKIFKYQTCHLLQNNRYLKYRLTPFQFQIYSFWQYLLSRSEYCKIWTHAHSVGICFGVRCRRRVDRKLVTLRHRLPISTRILLSYFLTRSYALRALNSQITHDRLICFRKSLNFKPTNKYVTK